ncbi:MAG: HNH endonuclease signature motif containing protein, partial [Mycobacterium sp.]
MFEVTAAGVLLDRMCAASRAENQAAGQRLAAVGELHLLRARETGGCEDWATDTWDAVTAEVAAALGISQALASSYVGYARVMRNELPKVGALLVAGEISYSVFQTIVYRTELITDPEVMAGVDAELAAKARRWPSMTRGRLAALVDRVVARADRDAVRRRREQQADREFSIWDSGNGLAEVFGRLISTDAHAVDARLDALADTVCANDPRTRKQRRADALGALAAGVERLACRCGRTDCVADAAPAPGPVVIHVVAEQGSLDGTGQAPGSMFGTDALIPAELVAELARSAKLRPLIHPTDAPPEPGYTPSTALADFVRCRDLTCRFPGCDRPAVTCDLDHTIAYGDGGPTHASNLKCLCRLHHLVKTFWGWHDQQLPDATVIWTSPAGHTYVTTPGSALLFP